MGDTITVETIIVRPVETVTPEEVLPNFSIEQADTPQTILTGKVMIDTNTIIHPKSVDSVKKKKTLTPDSPNCNNQNFINL